MIDIESASAVYAIRNIKSGRVYIGSSAYVVRRWADHRRLLSNNKHHSKTLQRSWNKHGGDAFLFEIIEYVVPDQLLIREQYWIEKLYAACPKLGFNILPNAGTVRGVKRSDEVRAKLSAAARGRKKKPRTEQHRLALALANRGKTLSAETRAKISAATLGKKRSPHSPETREKLRIAGKKNGMPRTTSIKAWAASRGRRHSEKTRAMISETHKRRFQNPEIRAQRSAAAKADWARRKSQ